VYLWLDGQHLERFAEDVRKEIIDMLSRARDWVEEVTLERALTGDYNPKIATMVLTNFGYTRSDEDRGITIKLEGAGADAQSWSK
jgi:hypothetical protein